MTIHLPQDVAKRTCPPGSLSRPHPSMGTRVTCLHSPELLPGSAQVPSVGKLPGGLLHPCTHAWSRPVAEGGWQRRAGWGSDM